MLEIKYIASCISIVKNVVPLLKPRYRKQRIVLDRVDAAVTEHMRWIYRWASEAPTKFTAVHRDLKDVYVDLDVGNIGSTSRNACVTLAQLFESPDKHVVLYGQPGAGKSTAVKHACMQMIARTTPDDFAGKLLFPIVVRVRDLGESTLVARLLGVLGITIEWPLDDRGQPVLSTSSRDQEAMRVLAAFLNEQAIAVFIDGVDEAPESKISQIASEINTLCTYVEESLLFITLRDASTSAVFVQSHICRLKPLSKDQMQLLSMKWLGSRERAAVFMDQARSTPWFDSIDRPLTFVHLCMLFELRGQFPDLPIDVYQQVINLYLEEWDRIQNVPRLSSYGKFGSERKRQFLAAIAYDLASNGNRINFSSFDLSRIYERIHRRFDLPADIASDVVREIESHTGLLVEAALGGYEFSHLSIQEFLTADHISRLSVRRHADEIMKMPNACAIAVAMSSDPDELLVELVYLAHRARRGGGGSGGTGFLLPLVERMSIERVRFIGHEIHIAVALACIDTLVRVVGDALESHTLETYRVAMSGIAGQPNVREQLRVLNKRFSEKDARRKCWVINNNSVVEEVLGEDIGLVRYGTWLTARSE